MLTNWDNIRVIYRMCFKKSTVYIQYIKYTVQEGWIFIKLSNES